MGDVETFSDYANDTGGIVTADSICSGLGVVAYTATALGLAGATVGLGAPLAIGAGLAVGHKVYKSCRASSGISGFVSDKLN